LSRRIDHNTAAAGAPPTPVQLSSIAAAAPDPEFLAKVQAAYEHDTWLTSSANKFKKFLVQKDGLWYFQQRLVIPRGGQGDKTLQLLILRECHDSAISMPMPIDADNKASGGRGCCSDIGRGVRGV
jgi:hypothetical protein